ncbi:MAG: carboxylesterase [Treponema sp.]|nr:MAG: carboxylesterase [Treponema sp.]
MFFDNYPFEISKYARPRYFKGLRSAPAILLIHGFTGSPMEPAWLGKQLNDAGYTVYIPRLSGHGTNKADFLDSTWKDWLRTASEAYLNISAEHETVYVGGHSMGGLLASLVAAKFNPEKLLLFAPAFLASGGPVWLSPFLKFFVKTLKSESESFYKEPEFIKTMSDYIGVNYVAKVADFYKLQKLAKKNLRYVKAETFIVLSKNDQQVPITVKDFLDKNLKASKEYMILEESSHNVIDDMDREPVAKRVIGFLKT